MSDLADLYPGFASQWIDTSAGRIFARTGGKGPPLLLLHGYPQTNVMWHRVAPALAQHFSLVIADLPGYGWSDAPQADADHAPYTKRAMAKAMVEVMEKRRPRALPARRARPRRPRRLPARARSSRAGSSKLATLDIVPTWAMWHDMDARLAIRAWHWTFLALPAPFPETLIGKDPVYYFDCGRRPAPRSRTSPRSIRARSRTTTPSSRTRCAFTRPARTIAPAAPPISRTTRPIVPPARRSPARCSRSGARRRHPERRPKGRSTTWREWATDVRGFPIDSGHYLAEENPRATAKALLDFFDGG